MMPNVTRGEDAPGLVGYLFGPGRFNEHVNQRLIASHAGIVGQGGPHFRGPGELEALAREFDAPRQLFGTEVKGGHVWHCSISLPPEDGRLSDEQWAQVARRVMDDMGFSEASGKAPCRWLAVHHGPSKDGNDHIHLMVNLVRDDGTKASVWRDYPRVQQICGTLEREMGLRVVEGRGGRTVPGIKRGEQESAVRRGRPEPDRRTLARRVRAAAAVTGNEADFVRQLRSTGVIARPRYASGGRDEVTGYSVALQPAEGAQPVWYGGGKLAGDLSLTRLREQWPDSDPAAAVAVWSERGAGERRRVNAALRDEAAWEVAAQQIADARARLADIPPEDTVRWSQAAQETAGVLAAWSGRLETARPGPLARAADVLARSAQRTHEDRRAPLAERPGALKGAAMVTWYARGGGTGVWGQFLMVQQLRNVLRAVHDMHQARDERDQARAIAAEARGGLAELQQARQQMMQSPGALPGPGSYRQQHPEQEPEGRGHDERGR
ncbi:relaxase/mobilization nuclease domain-containing protein [Streptomyces sp. NPDC018045]|uniref:relaxase/mobilization nuclease domain-containing protein n=1 Tax=Streptomyces sp. NPDC018045 TaxID=3365037 RepID=UPI00379FAA75